MNEELVLLAFCHYLHQQSYTCNCCFCLVVVAISHPTPDTITAKLHFRISHSYRQSRIRLNLNIAARPSPCFVQLYSCMAKPSVERIYQTFHSIRMSICISLVKYINIKGFFSTTAAQNFHKAILDHPASMLHSTALTRTKVLPTRHSSATTRVMTMNCFSET